MYHIQTVFGRCCQNLTNFWQPIWQLKRPYLGISFPEFDLTALLRLTGRIDMPRLEAIRSIPPAHRRRRRGWRDLALRDRRASDSALKIVT